MKLNGRHFHEQKNGELICEHRDLSVCEDCLASSVKLVDIYGAVYFIPDAAEREAILTELEEFRATTAATAPAPVASNADLLGWAATR